MIAITLEADLPDDDLEAFLHWMRAFDKTHGGCHFRLRAEGNSDLQSMGDIVSMLERVGIPLVYAERKR